MTELVDFLLLAVIVLDLYAVSTSRLAACVRASAIQGAALGCLPIALWAGRPTAHLAEIGAISAGTLIVKAVVIPRLLLRAIREAGVRREVEPFVSLHVSVVIATLLIALSFWLGRLLVLPGPVFSTLLVPAAFATLLIGFLMLVSRKKAVAQVVGYLLVENGVFIMGQTLAGDIPLTVELGILLDLFVGIFIFGITIFQISDEFDHIDTSVLTRLRG